MTASSGSIAPFTQVSACRAAPAETTAGPAEVAMLYATRAKSWSSAAPKLGTPSELMFAARTRTVTRPVVPAGRKTLSVLLRGSAEPPGVEKAPLKTLPR